MVRVRASAIDYLGQNRLVLLRSDPKYDKVEPDPNQEKVGTDPNQEKVELDPDVL